MNLSIAIAGYDDMSHEDSELIVRCKQGDLHAYEELLRRHREGLYRVAYAIVGDCDQAEDVVQEAFLHVEGDAFTGLLIGAGSGVYGGPCFIGHISWHILY